MERGITDRPAPPDCAVVARVEYWFDPEDYVEGFLIVWVQALRRRIHLAFGALFGWSLPFLCLLGLGALMYLIGVPPAAWFVFSPILAVSFLLVVAQSYMVVVPLRAHVRRKGLRRRIQSQCQAGLIRSPRKDSVALTSQGFFEVNDFGETTNDGVRIVEHKEFWVPWSAVGEFDATEQLAILPVKNKGYLFLPRRAFASEDVFMQFVATAERLRGAAQAGLAAPSPARPAGPPDGRLRLPL